MRGGIASPEGNIPKVGFCKLITDFIDLSLQQLLNLGFLGAPVNDGGHLPGESQEPCLHGDDDGAPDRHRLLNGKKLALRPEKLDLLPVRLDLR